jgi:hypothetical protein
VINKLKKLKQPTINKIMKKLNNLEKNIVAVMLNDEKKGGQQDFKKKLKFIKSDKETNLFCNKKADEIKASMYNILAYNDKIDLNDLQDKIMSNFYKKETL